MLKECICDHGHERVSVQPLPGSPLKVIEAEFFLHLLMRLFANPACLDGSGEPLQTCVGWQVGKIIFALA